MADFDSGRVHHPAKRIAKPTIQLQLGFTGVELLGHIGGVDFEEAKAEAILSSGAIKIATITTK